MEYLTKLLHL